MRPCPHHYDPTCERCVGYASELTSVSSDQKPPTGSEKKTRFENCAGIIFAFLVVLSFLVGVGLLIPGLLMPTKEVVLIEIDSIYTEGDEVRVDFVLDEKEHRHYISASAIDVARRIDGKNHTSLVLRGRNLRYPYFTKVTILVPDDSDVDAWKSKISEICNRKKEAILPRRVVP